MKRPNSVSANGLAPASHLDDSALMSIKSEQVFLAKSDQKRLERVTALTGRSPKSMLRFVLREGFEAIETDIRETLAAERDLEVHGGIPHAEVMKGIRKMIEFQETVNAVRRRNAKTSPAIVEAEIAEAIHHVRAGLRHNRG